MAKGGVAVDVTAGVRRRGEIERAEDRIAVCDPFAVACAAARKGVGIQHGEKLLMSASTRFDPDAVGPVRPGGSCAIPQDLQGFGLILAREAMREERGRPAPGTGGVASLWKDGKFVAPLCRARLAFALRQSDA